MSDPNDGGVGTAAYVKRVHRVAEQTGLTVDTIVNLFEKGYIFVEEIDHSKREQTPLRFELSKEFPSGKANQ